MGNLAQAESANFHSSTLCPAQASEGLAEATHTRGVGPVRLSLRSSLPETC